MCFVVLTNERCRFICSKLNISKSRIIAELMNAEGTDGIDSKDRVTLSPLLIAADINLKIFSPSSYVEGVFM